MTRYDATDRGYNRRKLSSEIPFHSGILDQELLVPVAHRGGNGEVENTLGALAAAQAAGFYFAEVDIHCTRDEIPVLFHGDSKTKDTLKKLDYADLNTDKVHKKLGFEGSRDNPIPRLADALDSFTNMRFFLDQKSGRVSEPVARVIKDLKAYDRVSLDGDRWERTIATLEALPKRRRHDMSLTMGPLALAALHAKANKIPGDAFLIERYLRKASNCSLPLDTVDKRVLDIAHDYDKPVFVYRVNNEADVAKAARIGALGIMIDRLDLLEHPSVTQ